MAETQKVESVTPIQTEPYSDGELDSRFGGLPKADRLTPREDLRARQAEEAMDQKLSYEKAPLPDGDAELSDEKWLYTHLNRIAQKDLKATIEPDRWQPEAVICVTIQGVEGKITRQQIAYIRSRRDLNVVDAMIGRGFLAGWLPAYRDYGRGD